MPIKHAAFKQLRKDGVRTARNQAIRGELRTVTKRLLTLLKNKQFDEAKKLLAGVISQYDRAVTKGIMHRNTAARYKSRLSVRLNKSAKP